VVNYEYISLLWSEELGIIMLVGAVILQIVGMFVISRIVKIEI
nr:type II secretion protein F [Desulfuromonadales bacterium]